MKFDDVLLDTLSAQAKCNPRLRQSFDLRNSEEDNSQRMLNALEIGTVLPVHRHRTSSECVVVLRGKCEQFIYDDKGNVVDSVVLEAGTACAGMSVEKDVWHRLECLESGTVILECKDGKYEPIVSADILNI